jgi:hypothetical protein
MSSCGFNLIHLVNNINTHPCSYLISWIRPQTTRIDQIEQNRKRGKTGEEHPQENTTQHHMISNLGGHREVKASRLRITGSKIKITQKQGKGPVHPAYNPSYSACFFSQNSIFLSQKISQQCFSAGL